MINRILTTALIFTCLCCASCRSKTRASYGLNEPSPDHAAYNLKGPVRRVVEYRLDFDPESEIDHSIYYTMKELDSWLQTAAVTSEPNLILMFDENGRLSEECCLAFECAMSDDIQAPATRKIFSYNLLGQIQKVDVYDHDKLQYQHTFDYDDMDRLRRKEINCHKWSEKSTVASWEYNYDPPMTIVKKGFCFRPFIETTTCLESGLVYEIHCVDENGDVFPLSERHDLLKLMNDTLREEFSEKLVVSKRFEYDRWDRIHSVMLFRKNGSVQIESYTYDSEGRLSRIDTCDAEAPETITRSQRFQYGLNLEGVYTSAQIPACDETCFDESGRVWIETQNGATTFHLYRDDEFGNWTEHYSYGVGKNPKGFQNWELVGTKRTIDYETMLDNSR